MYWLYSIFLKQKKKVAAFKKEIIFCVFEENLVKSKEYQDINLKRII